jgi:hypothetical protein
VQTPLTHAEFEHAAAEPHVPLALHVSTPLPEHCVAPGVHDPVHAPLTHAWFVQALAFCQVPVALHVCGCWPLHCV